MGLEAWAVLSGVERDGLRDDWNVWAEVFRRLGYRLCLVRSDGMGTSGDDYVYMQARPWVLA